MRQAQPTGREPDQYLAGGNFVALNSTMITLLPKKHRVTCIDKKDTSVVLIMKVPNPTKFVHFRPISLCNTIVYIIFLQIAW